MFEALSDVWFYMKTRKKYWLPPIIIFIFLFGILSYFGQNAVVAPFIYTLF